MASHRLDALKAATQSDVVELGRLRTDLDREAAVLRSIELLPTSRTGAVDPAALQLQTQHFETVYLQQIETAHAIGLKLPCVPSLESDPRRAQRTRIARAANCPALMVFPYGNPEPTWRLAIADKAGVGSIVLNIYNGPGFFPYSEATYPVQQAERSGIRVLGYVFTSQGSRPLAAVEHDVAVWAHYYPVDGYFVDNVAGSPDALSYYRRLAAYMRSETPHAYVVLNMEQDHDVDNYLSFADVANVFEGSVTNFVALPSSTFPRSYPADRFGSIVKATSGSRMSQILSLAAARGIGNVYVTDRPTAAAFFALPTYFAREVRAVAGGCGV